jgi:hypothetical protein
MGNFRGKRVLECFYKRFRESNKAKYTVEFNKLTDYINSRNYLLSKSNNKQTPEIAKLNELIKDSANRADYYKKCVYINVYQHNALLNIVNDKINDAILELGYEFYLGGGLSNISIYSVGIAKEFKENRSLSKMLGKRINWGETNKNKKAILDRGGIPLKLVKDDNDNIIETNNGESYMVYYTEDNRCYYRWKPSDQTLPNVKYFSFKPNAENVKKLFKLAAIPENKERYNQKRAIPKGDITHVNLLKAPTSI